MLTPRTQCKIAEEAESTRAEFLGHSLGAPVGSENFRHSRRYILNFASLVIAFMIFASLINSVGVIVLQSIRTLGITKQQAGALQPFVDMPMAFSSLMIGAVLPTLGLRRAMSTALGLSVIACILMPLFGQFWVSKLHLVIIGLCFAAAKVTVYTAIGTMTTSKKMHASLMSIVEGLFMVGILSGYWLFGSFSDAGARAGRWLDTYWVFAILLAFSLVVFSLNPVPEQRPVHDSKANPLNELWYLGKLALKPLILAYAVSDFLYVLLEQGIGAWLPTFNSEILHLPTSISIEVAGGFSLCLAAGGLLGGVVLRRFTWFSVLLVCLAGVAGVILAALPLATHSLVRTIHTLRDVPAIAFLFPAAGLFMGPINPAINSAVLSSLPTQHQSAMSGLIIVFSSIGGTTGALVTGSLFQAQGPDAFYFLLAPIILLCVVLWVFRKSIDEAHGLRAAAATGLDP
jgi:MFS transporter, FHS family, glucose/mannose:H+ symporter